MTESNKTKQFRDLLMSSHLEFLLEAHNGISAKIAAHQQISELLGFIAFCHLTTQLIRMILLISQQSLKQILGQHCCIRDKNENARIP